MAAAPIGKAGKLSTRRITQPLRQVYTASAFFCSCLSEHFHLFALTICARAQHD
jgi:hypothetical protein